MVFIRVLGIVGGKLKRLKDTKASCGLHPGASLTSSEDLLAHYCSDIRIKPKLWLVGDALSAVATEKSSAIL